MAPSRGLRQLFKLQPRGVYQGKRFYSNFSQFATDPSRKAQVYISRTFDPYVNLSIEHYLLQKSPPDSTILFLYTNRPCIVVGRNQNPWVEVNLSLLNRPNGEAKVGNVDLVRRRSGGGTVFHDEGNVNYSVICPTSVFDRDRHAQMVVRALHKLGVQNARVNERHDIVLDVGNDLPFGSNADQFQEMSPRKPLKVSGSAYKLTRLRSVHHGTCLLSSPNIKSISQYLKSPAKPYIKARGVDSVSSPVTNVNIPNEVFEMAVVAEFEDMYNSETPIFLNGEECSVPEISKGLTELRSLDWIYLQTPQFTFSSQKTEDDPRERPPLPTYLPKDLSLSFTVRNGAVIEVDLNGEKRQEISDTSGQLLERSFLGKQIHDIPDWQDIVTSTKNEESVALARWLNELFGKSSAVQV